MHGWFSPELIRPSPMAVWSNNFIIFKEESSSLTATTDSVILSSLIDPTEHCKVVTIDIANVFIQTDVEDKTIMWSFAPLVYLSTY